MLQAPFIINNFGFLGMPLAHELCVAQIKEKMIPRIDFLNNLDDKEKTELLSTEKEWGAVDLLGPLISDSKNHTFFIMPPLENLNDFEKVLQTFMRLEGFQIPQEDHPEENWR